MSKCSNTATAREEIADERDTLEEVSFDGFQAAVLIGSICLSNRSCHPHTPRLPGVDRARLREALQQVWKRFASRVRHEADHASGAGVYIEAVRLHEQGIARRDVVRSGDGTTGDNEKPSLSFRFQTPIGI